jgi:purine-nucleoside phosphorylase
MAAQAAAVIASKTGRSVHDVALVLGSGLGDYASSLPGAVPVPYAQLPGYPVPKVEGHAGTLVSTKAGDGHALVLVGRVHLYEGWNLSDLVFPVRTAVLAGCRTVVLTNAAGGVAPGLEAGDLVLISDHLNLTGRNPLFGENDERWGPRFPDLSDLYSEELRRVAMEVARGAGIELKEGVYAWMTGPSYETPAEIRMIARLGGDLVGMSTVPEAIAVSHAGGRVLGISLVTNLAAGIGPAPLSHTEVQVVAAKARDRIGKLLDALLPRLVEVPA